MINVEDERLRMALNPIDIANKENALFHLQQALEYSNCEVIDVDITFRSGATFRANVSMDSVGAMIYDIFKQCEWLRS